MKKKNRWCRRVFLFWFEERCGNRPGSSMGQILDAPREQSREDRTLRLLQSAQHAVPALRHCDRAVKRVRRVRGARFQRGSIS